jgi:hypothetical protein
MSHTPRANIIMDNVRIAIQADTREQSIAHREEAQREIESIEEELNAARAELAVVTSERDQFMLASQDDYKWREEAKAARAELAALKAAAPGPVCGLQGCVCHWCNQARRSHINPEAFAGWISVRADEVVFKEAAPEPLDRPDKPGPWWMWCATRKEWQVVKIAYPNNHQWMSKFWRPATPPPNPTDKCTS